MLKRYLISLIFIFFNLTAMQTEKFQRSVAVNVDTIDVASLTQNIDENPPKKIISKLKLQLLQLSDYEKELQRQLNPKTPLDIMAIINAVSTNEYNPISEKAMSANELKIYLAYSAFIEQEKHVYSTYEQLMKELFPRHKASANSVQLAEGLFSWADQTLEDRTLLPTVLDMQK